MRAYLDYKMKINKISREKIQELLTISEKTLRNKLSGRTDFTWSEVKLIRNTFFPEEDYDKLFESSDQPDEKEE